MLQHVKEIIKKIKYEQLLDCSFPKKIVWERSQSSKEKVSYPHWVEKKKCYRQFGMFIDVVVRQMINDICLKKNIPCKLGDSSLSSSDWSKDLDPTALTVFSGYNSKSLLPCENTLRSCIDFDGLYLWLERSLPNVPILLAPEYNLVTESITSHPDLIFGSLILDIKTTKNFSTMQKNAILQVISYYSIMKRLGYYPTAVGFLLPLQKEIKYLEVPDNFEYDKFLQIMSGVVSEHSYEVNLTTINTLALSLIYDGYKKLFSSTGSHIPKGKTIHFSINSYLQSQKSVKTKLSIQMFLRCCRSGKAGKFNDKDIEDSKNLIEVEKIDYFTHTPYIINLCDPATKKSDTEENPTQWCLDFVRDDLKITERLGGKGVVIHTGKKKKMSDEDGEAEMRKYISTLLESATERCPLILETGAGQGTELFCDPESLATFYKTFTQEEQKKFKICIDTCHVFSAGVDPFEYIQRFLKICQPEDVALIHFNNSMVPIGSCRDRHAGLTHGHINMKSLCDVAVWAVTNNIPLVNE